MAQTPAKRLQTKGNAVPHTPVAAVTAGDVVLIGAIPHIADGDIAAAALGNVSCEGIYSVPKDSSTFAAGDAVYWDPSGSPVTGTASSGAATSTPNANLMGYASKAAATGVDAVEVKLSAAKRTATIAGSVTADDITGSDASLAIVGKAGSSGAGGIVAAAGGAGDTNAAGGVASVTGGAGNGTAAGGAAAVAGGAGGATGAGGAASVTGGAGGATSGTGGAVSVAGGAGTNGNANGGAVSVLGGNAHGSGTDGVANVGTSNTSQVNIAAASIPTAMPGPINQVAGGSTAAAGSTTADAGELPAATAGVYPTTAADDTKGVRVNAADKVTGRTILIGNGVSNKVLKVYAPSGGAINGAAADAAFSSASGKGVIIHCLNSSANTWLAW
jgi:predicted RecA/RadA family phage recombinase